MDATAQFGENLRRLRRESGLTQEGLSARTKIDTGEISRLERGARDPQLRTIVRIARGLDVTVAELLAGIR